MFPLVPGWGGGGGGGEVEDKRFRTELINLN